jgi:hypothetical protein
MVTESLTRLHVSSVPDGLLPCVQVLWPIQTPMQWLPQALLPRVNRLQCEADHLPLSNTLGWESSVHYLYKKHNSRAGLRCQFLNFHEEEYLQSQTLTTEVLQAAPQRPLICYKLEPASCDPASLSANPVQPTAPLHASFLQTVSGSEKLVQFLDWASSHGINS